MDREEEKVEKAALYISTMADVGYGRAVWEGVSMKMGKGKERLPRPGLVWKWQLGEGNICGI